MLFNTVLIYNIIYNKHAKSQYIRGRIYIIGTIYIIGISTSNIVSGTPQNFMLFNTVLIYNIIYNKHAKSQCIRGRGM